MSARALEAAALNIPRGTAKTWVRRARLGVGAVDSPGRMAMPGEGSAGDK
ncbi:MAG TPA: hypothetical protein VFD82_02020 [Planctomycetota bacterium]|nr:hypothetical protein [Planctomycetota bacterium]